MEKKVSKLASLIEAVIADHVPPKRPSLSLVRASERQKSTMDPITRESHVRMIRHFNRLYRLQVLVDQATFGLAGLEQLDDDALVRLHSDMQQARECIVNGISIEEAGLIRSRLE